MIYAADPVLCGRFHPANADMVIVGSKGGELRVSLPVLSLPLPNTPGLPLIEATTWTALKRALLTTPRGEDANENGVLGSESCTST